MSPELSRLDPDVFTAVAEYLDRGEYGPNILDEGGLEDTLDPESLVHEVTRCGTIYAMAQELDVPGLQALVFRKLQALAPYHQPAEVLDVVALVFARGEEDIRQYLVWLLVEGWWDFVFEVPEKLFVAMTSDAVLAKGVYAKLGEIAEVEDEVRKEGVEDAQSGKGKGKQSVDNAEKASESNSAEAKVARR